MAVDGRGDVAGVDSWNVWCVRVGGVGSIRWCCCVVSKLGPWVACAHVFVDVGGNRVRLFRMGLSLVRGDVPHVRSTSSHGRIVSCR